MKRYSIRFFLMMLCYFCVGQVGRAAERPKVLIIGDSISIGYTPHVKKALKKVAEVRRHKGNAEHTGTGLKKLDQWLGKGEWDVIHFNWGLWDLCYRHPESKVQGKRDKVKGTVTTTPEQYGENLEKLVARLKKTGAKLVWASTTFVPSGEAGRKQGDDVRYNLIASEIMKKHGVIVNDLHSLTKTFETDFFVKRGDVHYTKEGYQKIAKMVSKEILNVISSE